MCVSSPSLINNMNPYLFPNWHGSLVASVRKRRALCVAASSSILLLSSEALLMSKTSRTSIQVLDIPPPELFSAFIAAMNAECRARMRKRRKATRVVEGDVSKEGFLIHPFPCSGEVSNRPTLFPRVDRQSRKKKDPEEGAARIFLVDHSLRAPSFTFTRDSFRAREDGGRRKRGIDLAFWQPTLIDLRVRKR